MHRSIAGYGRPLINGDERNPHILALAQSLGLDQGPYLRLAISIEETLFAGRWRMKMNYAGMVAALVADIGFLAAGVLPVSVSGIPRWNAALFHRGMRIARKVRCILFLAPTSCMRENPKRSLAQIT